MIDMYAAEEHFVDHLAPIWGALPFEQRGTFWTPSGPVVQRARMAGVLATPVEKKHEKRPMLVASYGDVKRARSFGNAGIALLQHGAGQSYAGNPGTANHGSYSGGTDHKDVGLFLCPNEMSAARWRDAYPDARVVVNGSPKVEALPHREGAGEPTVAVSFHWQCNIVPETRPAFMHFRTALPELMKNYRVIGHAHPRARRWLEPWYKRYGIKFVEHFDDVCRQADVYICDNSSTIYEFAATGRPVVLLNAPWYRKNVQHGLRFWDKATVGLQVDGPDGLPEAVSCSLVDPRGLREERERVVREVYGEVRGSTDRTVAALMEWVA